jgi:hypothetical protein
LLLNLVWCKMLISKLAYTVRIVNRVNEEIVVVVVSVTKGNFKEREIHGEFNHYFKSGRHKRTRVVFLCSERKHGLIPLRWSESV